MGHPAPSTGRRSAVSTAGSPRCISCGCRPMRRLRLAFRQRPRASSARLSFATRRSQGPLQSGDPQMAGVDWTPAVAIFAPRQSGLNARLLPGRSARYRNGSRRPSAISGAPPSPLKSATWRTVPWCGASPRPLRYSRSVARRTRCPAPGPGFPDRRRIAPARPASRTTGFPRQMPYRYGNAELLRRAQVALDFRVPPAMPSQTAPTWESQYTHHQRITTAASLAALAAKGSAPGFAPRHYRISATRCAHAASRPRPCSTLAGSGGAHLLLATRFQGRKPAFLRRARIG